jgi:hypothetical protein
MASYQRCKSAVNAGWFFVSSGRHKGTISHGESIEYRGKIFTNTIKIKKGGVNNMIKLFRSPAKLFLIVLVVTSFIYPSRMYGAASIPLVAGPLKVTEDSYPFGAAATTVVPQDLSKLGYVEEEFFVSGKANVYDFDTAGKVAVKTPDAPYTTRILVRRPAAASKFSGNVIVELLNPSFLYDFDAQWMFCRDYFMEHGDVWIGITVKPVAARALKKFNPERYAPLSWANPLPLNKTCPKPASLNSDTVPETENGLAWDIISQVGALVRSNEKQNPLRGFRVEYVYATGYSQTGAYLTTYINFIRPLATAMQKNGKPVYDGYVIGDGDGSAPAINQCTQEFPPGVTPIIIRPRKEPVISVVTEGSVIWSLPSRRQDSDSADDRYRRYEVPGASHANTLVFEFALRPGETDKVGVPAPAPNCIGADKYGLTDFHLEYFMNAAFASLDAWARSNIPPPKAQVIETVPGSKSAAPEVKLDKHGNAVGGLRTPYHDVPVAIYRTKSVPADEKSAQFCDTQGYKIPFEKEKIIELYPTRESYLRKVNDMVDSMVKGKGLTKADGERVKREAEKVSAW